MPYKLFVGLILMLFSPLMGWTESKISFALDWKFEGPSSPYFYAIDKGFFKAEGLEVEISAGKGSLDAIPKVATGAFPIGFADINSIAKFLDKNPGAPVTGVMMIYDKPPFAIAGRRSLGVNSPKDLEGRTLGAPPPDGAWAQFPAFASANNLAEDKITVEPVGFPTREPMLAEKKVDAITGFSFSMFLNLVRLGVPEDDISILLMADHGLDLYGNSIIVNTDFAKKNPEVVTGFLRAVAKGWKEAISNPMDAVKSMIKRNPAADLALETRRLQLAIDGNVVTDYTTANGIGNIDPTRMARAIKQLGENYQFDNTPNSALYFTDEYLPRDGSLRLN